MNTDVINGLRVSLDWAAFTVLDDSFTVEGVMNFLGFTGESFSLAPRGASGYKTMHVMEGRGVRILSDGMEGMGIHVDVPGSSIPHVLKSFYLKHGEEDPFHQEFAFEVEDFHASVLSTFFREVNKIGHFTRCDIALDDTLPHFSVGDLLLHLDRGDVVSKFRKYRLVSERALATGESTSQTVYFGSRSSGVFLRVYDKQLEQTNKHPEEPVTHPWVRWEFEIKADRAVSLARLIATGQPLGEVYMGLLNNYIRIVKQDDSNRTRCTVDPAWAAFVASVQKLSLYIPGEPKTLDDKRAWVEKQVLPTLTGLIIADGMNLGIIHDHWDASVMRMKPDLIGMVQAALNSSGFVAT